MLIGSERAYLRRTSTNADEPEGQDGLVHKEGNVEKKQVGDKSEVILCETSARTYCSRKRQERPASSVRVKVRLA